MSQNLMSESEQIEVSIEEAKKFVARADDVRTLSDNPSFKRLVMEGYFVQEAARLAHLSSDPTIDEKIRGFVMRDMAGPGSLKRYFQTIINMGNSAASEIRQSEEALEDIRSEEAGE